MTPKIVALYLTEDISVNNGLILEGADLVEILSEQFPVLSEILRHHGIDTGKLRMLGRGDKGTTFTDGKLVVKITEDRNEANASASILGQNIPNVVKIYYVGKFMKSIAYQEEGDEHPIDTEYYIIIEDLVQTKMSNFENNAADLLGDFLLDYHRKIKWPFNLRDMVDFFYKYAYIKTHENIKSPIVDKLVIQLLSGLLRLKEKGVLVLDVKSSNTGKDSKGNYVLFDLGVSESPKVAIPTIS